MTASQLQVICVVPTNLKIKDSKTCIVYMFRYGHWESNVEFSLRGERIILHPLYVLMCCIQQPVEGVNETQQNNG